MHRRTFILGLLLMPIQQSLFPAEQSGWDKTFFVMDTWFWQADRELDVPRQAALIKELGYSGMALSWGQQHSERLKALKENDLEIPGIFITAEIDGEYPPQLKNVVGFLKGTRALVWLSLASKKYKNSDSAGDEAAAILITRLADDLKTAGLPGIALYHHVGTWLERSADCVRLAERLKRPDVGMMFNQYQLDGGRRRPRFTKDA